LSFLIRSRADFDSRWSALSAAAPPHLAGRSARSLSPHLNRPIVYIAAMDPVMLREHLAHAERHVEEGERTGGMSDVAARIGMQNQIWSLQRH